METQVKRQRPDQDGCKRAAGLIWLSYGNADKIVGLSTQVPAHAGQCNICNDILSVSLTINMAEHSLRSTTEIAPIVMAQLLGN